MELFAFDDDYVRRLSEGDGETVAHFYDYFRSLLLLKLRRRLRSMDAIDEVRQEVFARCLQNLASLRDARKLGAFVNAICNRVLMEYYRAEGRTESVEELPDLPIDAMAEDAFESARSSRRVRLVLDSLEPRDAAILRAVFIEENDKDEICRRFGVERAYLRVLLHRAKDKFRARYLRRRSGRLSVVETFGSRSSLLH